MSQSIQEQAEAADLKRNAEWQFSLDIHSSDRPSYVNGFIRGHDFCASSLQGEVERLRKALEEIREGTEPGVPVGQSAVVMINMKAKAALNK